MEVLRLFQCLIFPFILLMHGCADTDMIQFCAANSLELTPPDLVYCKWQFGEIPDLVMLVYV